MKPTALLIDDDASVQVTMKYAMNKLGVDCVSVGTIGEFLKALRSREFQLFLVDLNLSEEDGTSGLDVIEQIRKERGVSAPVIVISGSEDFVSVSHSLEIGANDYVMKPFDRDMLAAKVGRFVKSKELQEARASFVEFPEGRVPAKLTVGAQITEVDETGVRLRGPHLIPKGAAIKASGTWIEECLGAGASPLLTVTNTWMEPDGKTYGAYAEFDVNATEVLQAVRRWLATVTATPTPTRE